MSEHEPKPVFWSTIILRVALVLVLLAALAASYVIAAHLEPPLQRWTRELLCRLRPAPAS